MTQQLSKDSLFDHAIDGFFLYLEKAREGDKPITRRDLTVLQGGVRRIAAIFADAVADASLTEIRKGAARLDGAFDALAVEERRMRAAQRLNGVKPGDTVIIRRHFANALKSDTPASFVSLCNGGSEAEVILSGGCRATFRQSDVIKLADYKAGEKRHSLIDPQHEDEVQRREHGDWAKQIASFNAKGAN